MPQQAIEQTDRQPIDRQMQDVEWQRVEAKYLQQSGANRDRQGPKIGPAGILPGPPGMGDAVVPVEAIAVDEVRKSVALAQFEVVVIVEPKADRQAMAMNQAGESDQ